MTQADARLDDEKIRQFASNADIIPAPFSHFLQETILFDQPLEFYYGYASALAFTHQVSPARAIKTVIASVLAVICKHIIEDPLTKK